MHYTSINNMFGFRAHCTSLISKYITNTVINKDKNTIFKILHTKLEKYEVAIDSRFYIFGGRF